MGQARDHESFDQRDALTHVKQLSDRILVEVQGVARRVDEGKVRLWCRALGVRFLPRSERG